MCKCGKESRPKQNNCWTCHASNMREWRKTHPLTGDAKVRDHARHYVNVYVRRGKVARETCSVEGCTGKAEKHHDDYSKPLQIKWLCRKHHLEVHNMSIRKVKHG